MIRHTTLGQEYSKEAHRDKVRQELIDVLIKNELNYNEAITILSELEGVLGEFAVLKTPTN